MNLVKIKRTASNRILVTNLIESRMSEHKHTAFIGTVNAGPHGLYLIYHTGVVFASDPTQTWPDGFAMVDRFCDVFITEKR